MDGDPDGRIRADTQVYAILRADGFQGPRWDRFADELARYGCAVMLAWLQSGTIVLKCKEKGRPIGALPATWTSDDRMEITLETVASALAIFRVSLAAGRWAPSRGASLRTYFAGSCVLALPGVLRAWRRDDERWQSTATEGPGRSADQPAGVEPLEVVEAKAAMDSLLKDKNKRTQAIFRLDFDGYTAAEIGEVLNMTPGAVRAALERGRRKFRQDEVGS